MNDKKIISKLLILFFKNIKNNYVVIKLNPDFPKIHVGSDIDVFYNDNNDIYTTFKKIIISSDVKEHVKIKKKLLNTNHMQIKFINKKNIFLLIFDFYFSLPEYKVVNLRKSFFPQCIKDGLIKEFKIDNFSFNVKIPNLFNDYLLRYVEFYEYFWTGEKKPWHLELIKNKLDKNEYNIFLDHLNHYIKPPIVPEKKFIEILYFYKNKLVLKYYIKKFLNLLKKKLK